MNRRMVWKLTACFAAVLLLFTAVLGTVFVSLFRQHITDINRVSLEKKRFPLRKPYLHSIWSQSAEEREEEA